ncbi:uncharacterized protein LOC118848618 isoform X2 [Trichosurus vulpecula]|uniref:uncharacterized protein LOC118848618 isoform X2 n=1 Tax=Trichosurus vulpecula TaxID=9337 RepID=UPI00186B078C|nr:uncharacterized protein LOC118848618 isoform X2 [Trichosurus vulpecula]
MFDFLGQRWSMCGLLFAWVLLNSFSHVTGNCTSEVGSSLNGTQGDDVQFHLGPKPGNDTWLITWYMESKNLVLLTISPGESRQSWINPKKEYEGRLSVASDGSLILKNVNSEDSGLYEAHIKSVSGEICIQKFNLTVFGSMSTESNMNPWSWSLIVPIPVMTGVLLVVLIVVCVYIQKRWNCLNTIKAIHRRRRSIPPELNHMEEKRPEEKCALVQMTSLSDQETQTRTHGALTAPTIEDNEGVMLARVCTAQESS